MRNIKLFFQHNRITLLAVLVIILTAFDVLYMTIYQDIFISPMVNFLSGTLICLFALMAFDKQTVENFTLAKPHLSFIRILAVMLPLIIGLYVVAPILAEIIVTFELSPGQSDVIPALQEIYVKRFLNGENVYAPFTGFGYTIYVNYLPTQWLPYLIAHGLNMDYRWLAFIIFVLSLLFWVFRLLKKPVHWLELTLKTALPFGALYFFLNHRQSSFGYSVELTIVGYYLILAYTLFQKSTVTRSIGILLPLLSRFSFLFWLMFYGVSSFLTERQNALKIIKWTTLGVVLIYVLPFFIRQPTAFFDGLKYYSKASFGEWSPKYWQEPNDYPFHLKNGASFSVYFYEYMGGELKERFDMATLFHKIMSISAALLIGLFFWWRKESDLKLTALVGLKLCVTWFYAFFYLPFFYLYFLPVFLSFPIIFELNIFQRKSKLT